MTLAVAGGVRFSSAHADTQSEWNLKAAIYLKVLSYDRNFAERTYSGHVVIGILYRQNSTASKAEAKRLRQALKEIARTTKIRGKGIRTRLLPWEPRTMANTIRLHPISALYITADMEPSLASICRLATNLQIPTLSSSHKHVRAGLGIAVTNAKKSQRIVINQAAVLSTGVRLDARVLALAEVVGSLKVGTTKPGVSQSK